MERAFMVVHGEAAVGTKRIVEHYEYAEHPVSNNILNSYLVALTKPH
jgi:hypothetical protein